MWQSSGTVFNMMVISKNYIHKGIKNKLNVSYHSVKSFFVPISGPENLKIKTYKTASLPIHFIFCTCEAQ
jgi:hypothetical protein